jgi:uncharacterized protein (DUF58 family)
VRASRFDVAASRVLRPPRVHAGGSSRVELTITNTSGRRTPVLTVRDPFDNGRRWARFPLAPLAPRDAARAAYRLPTDDRGVFPLGPMEIVVSDPFGLASNSRRVAGNTTLTVYPHIDTIAPMAGTAGADPTGSSGHPSALSLSGDEFYALREYQLGDDLRKVHWPSTARLDDIMIRQDELPWEGRATVLVDLRRPVHAAGSFEVALSAAASIINASWRTGALVRLATTGSYDSDFGTGQAHLDGIFERLAAAAPHSADADLASALAVVRKRAGGAIAVVTTSLTPAADLQAIARLRMRFGALHVVVVEPTAGDGGAVVRSPARTAAGSGMIRVGTGAPFAPAWNRAMLVTGRRPSAPPTTLRRLS